MANEKSRLALHAFLGRPQPAESEILATMEAKNLPEDPDDAWYGISLAQTSSLKKKFSWSGKSCVPRPPLRRVLLFKADS